MLDGGIDAAGVTALVGGEALPLALARELRTRVARLLNVYGPTETTIWSTAWEVPREPTHVSIGRPLLNTRVSVVDGELLIGGAGLAIGYHARPELTARRFVSDTHGAENAVTSHGTAATVSADGTGGTVNADGAHGA